MGRLVYIGEADGRLCDEAVDPDMSVNDDRGPSIDSMTSRSKAKGKAAESVLGGERLTGRVSRLAPCLSLESRIQAGGGPVPGGAELLNPRGNAGTLRPSQRVRTRGCWKQGRAIGSTFDRSAGRLTA
jgi:hypothetical protein